MAIDANPVLLMQILLLLGIANGTPIIAKKLLKDRLAAPLDAGLRFPDGYPVFGKSKTVRGVLIAVGCTAIAAPLVGLSLATGAALGAASMAGDLLSSFVKRRLGLPPHAQAFGLDQIPEALLPLLLLRAQFGLSAQDIGLLVVAFVVIEIVLSRVLFHLRIRDEPY
jgi:CDP-2,3-bis-(O-geranylgeranyl)-sn-glycerol synthase